MLLQHLQSNKVMDSNTNMVLVEAGDVVIVAIVVATVVLNMPHFLLVCHLHLLLYHLQVFHLRLPIFSSIGIILPSPISQKISTIGTCVIPVDGMWKVGITARLAMSSTLILDINKDVLEKMPRPTWMQDIVSVGRQCTRPSSLRIQVHTKLDGEGRLFM
jgi:hypothetical protein